MSEKINRQDMLIKDLISRKNAKLTDGKLKNEISTHLYCTTIDKLISFLAEWCNNYLIKFFVIILEFLQNATIEERVPLLEIQVVEIGEDLTDLGDDLTLLEENVNFLFDETIIQDQRIFSLEQISIDVDSQLDIIDDTVEGTRRLGSQRTRIAQRIWSN